jgi:hypothetical protein
MEQGRERSRRKSKEKKYVSLTLMVNVFLSAVLGQIIRVIRKFPITEHETRTVIAKASPQKYQNRYFGSVA